jgi:hypothetical protein
MNRRFRFALVRPAAMFMLLRAATGCSASSASNNLPATQDAGDDATASDAGSSTADAGDAKVAEGDANVAEGGAGRVPVNHRPSDAQCATSAAPGDCVAAFPDAGCASDSDCTEAGTNGRCINGGGGVAAPCACTSDKCAVDIDCPAGQTCACHGAPYTDGNSNTCVTGNCRVDADCGTQGYCSPSSLTAICGDSLAGYYCHTAADRCIDDSDCPGPSPGKPAGSAGCLYSTKDSRWECAVVPVCF